MLKTMLHTKACKTWTLTQELLASTPWESRHQLCFRLLYLIVLMSNVYVYMCVCVCVCVCVCACVCLCKYMCMLFIFIVQRNWACLTLKSMLTWKSAIEIKSSLLLLLHVNPYIMYWPGDSHDDNQSWTCQCHLQSQPLFCHSTLLTGRLELHHWLLFLHC